MTGPIHCSRGCSDSTASVSLPCEDLGPLRPGSTKLCVTTPHAFLRRSDCFCLLFHTQSLFKDMHLEASLFLDTPATVSLFCVPCLVTLFPLYMFLTFSFYVYEFSDEGAVAPRSRSTSAGSSARDATTCSSSVWRNILLPPQNMHRKNIEQHSNLPASLNNACQILLSHAFPYECCSPSLMGENRNRCNSGRAFRAEKKCTRRQHYTRMTRTTRQSSHRNK